MEYLSAISRQSCSGLDELLRLHRAERVVGVVDQLGLALRPVFAVAHLTLDLLATSRDLLALGAAFLHLGELGLEPLEAGLLPSGEFLMDDLDLGPHRLLELGQVLLSPRVIHVGDQICGEVDDLLEFLGRHVEQVAEPAGHTLEQPDMGHRGG